MEEKEPIMVWYPNAVRHNIPPGPNDPPITPRIIVLHVMEGSIESADHRFTNGEGVEAHFGFPKAGEPWQWRDTDFQADAQAAGNDYCISFETEGFAIEPLNANQIHWLLAVGEYLSAHYTIPARIVTATSERGWGYHRQFPSWNPNNHSCPGDIRLKQLETVIIPSLIGENMSLTDDDKRYLIRSIDHGDVNEPGNLYNHKELAIRINSLNTRLATIEGQMKTGIPITIPAETLDALAALVATKLATDGLKLSGTVNGTIELGGDA